MASHVVQLRFASVVVERSPVKRVHTKPSGVTSVEARPPGVSLQSMIFHDGPS